MQSTQIANKIVKAFSVPESILYEKPKSVGKFVKLFKEFPRKEGMGSLLK